jgi:hypothetical protein
LAEQETLNLKVVGSIPTRPILLGVALLLLLAAPAVAAQPSVVMFSSPSKNIGCVIDRSAARCDIRQRDWRPPPKPRSCELDWGFGLTVDRRGRGQFVCAGDTVLGSRRTLAYGDSIQRGRFRCVSRVRAMRCVNRRNGHGFALSKQFARRF